MSDLNVYTTAQINALTPITGDMVVDSDLNAIKLYDGSAWRTWNSDSTVVPFYNRWGASFDGLNDYLDLGTVSAFNNDPSAFSISIWFYGSQISIGGFSNRGVGFYTYNTDFYVHAGMLGSLSMSNPFNSSAWNHALLTYNKSGDTKFYVNGNTTPSLSAASANGLASIQAGNTYSIGRYTHYALYRAGLIDEVAIFTTELSTADLTKIYNSGVPTDLTLAASYDTANQEQNLAGYWRMGDDSNDSPVDAGNITGITDSSGNGNDATQSTASNQPTFSDLTPPPFENRWGASFDGLNDYLEVPHTTDLELTTAMTWSAWVNMNTTHTTDYPYLFAKWNSGNTAANYTFYTQIDSIPSGYFVMRYWDSSSAQPSSTNIPRGQWVHLAAVHNGTQLTYYVNGVADNTINVTTGSTNTGNLIIGRAPNGVRTFPGEIDEAAIFNSALSASDISSIYNSGVPADISSLNPVGWWRMGDDSNDSATAGGNIVTITDSSGNGNDATQSTASNQPTFKALDSSTTSLSFDGSSDYLNIDGASSTITASDNFTISVWVKSSTANGYIFRCSEAVDSNSFKETIGLGVFSNKTYALLQDGASYIEFHDTSGTTVDDNAWHNLALTISESSGASTIKVYVDGALAGTSGGSITIPNTISIASIGRRPYNSSGNGDLYFAGLIDDVAIFNSALSASDVASLASSRGAHVVNDLSLSPTAYYRMGEDDSLTDGASVSQITDASGNGHHATQATASNQPTGSVDSVIYA